MKRVARNLQIPWADVCQQRDALRQFELEQRASDDAARRDGWTAFVLLNGWSKSQLAWWRNGFQRVFGKRIARGCDYTSIPRYDEVADSVRESNAEYREWATEDIFDLLLSDYPQLLDVRVHYHNAVASLAAATLTDAVPF